MSRTFHSEFSCTPPRVSNLNIAHKHESVKKDNSQVLSLPASFQPSLGRAKLVTEGKELSVILEIPEVRHA